MPYTIAAIDVHKRVLMVVVATGSEQVKDPAGEALQFECHASERWRRTASSWSTG